ncbi:hypothetical protein GCQ56_08180 [Marinifilum sp. N1E240]|uniref:hypothetical protein n=1 Tax=Marinifilum sp. N1E240 TaxID=2608082 RepID=UPI00128E8F17|nr:hypothetical protein [Marinifilum sp. N1E240]MPQ46992.1 hypothetical protein [Marinifilum sp. N1E240]
MTNIKYAVTDIFQRDFAYHLFDGDKRLRNLAIYLPAISSALLQIILVTLGIMYEWNSGMITIVCVFISILLLASVYFIRFYRLKSMKLNAKELSNQILDKNYKAAIGKIFLDDERDIELLDEIIPLYETDVKKYNERFIHKATVVALVIAFFSYWFNLLFLDRLKEYLKLLSTDKLLLVAFLVLLVGGLIFLGYRIAIDIYYMKENKNSKVYERLCTLRYKLIKERKLKENTNS